jgi:hypothetical protein
MSQNPQKSEAVDYSKTLFLPQTEFPMRAGLPQREPEILKYWNEIDLYEKLRQDAAEVASRVWVRTLTGGDPGTTITIGLTAVSRGNIAIAVYSGVDGTTPIAGFAQTFEAGTTDQHVTPTVVNNTTNAWRVDYVCDKTATPCTTIWSVPGTAIKRLADDLRVSTAAAGQLRTVTGLVAGMTALLLGRIAGRLGLGRQLLAASALLALGSLASAAAPSFALLAVAQVPVGVGVAVATTAGTLAAAEWVAPQLTTYPGLAIMITVLALNLVGDALQERLGSR